jgi:prepilin-type N-terminal cleavage/methylation domain-containing protein
MFPRAAGTANLTQALPSRYKPYAGGIFFAGCPVLNGRTMNWFSKKISSSTGFTLAEVLTGIGLFGILAAIAVPNFNSTLPGLRLGDAARQIAIDLQQLRMKAIAQNIPYQATISSSTYLLQKCNGSCTSDSGNIALPTGITASASGAPQFLGRGTASAGVTITLSNGSTTKYVCVKTVGRVNIQDTTCS